MKRTVYLAAGAAVILAGAMGFVLRGRGETVSATAPISKTVNDGLIAAPGRIEAISEEVASVPN